MTEMATGERRRHRLLHGDDEHPGQRQHLAHIPRPPLTSITVPVRYPARSEARNRATLATSSGSPARPRGISVIFASHTSRRIVSVIGVRIRPGWMALTRTP